MSVKWLRELDKEYPSLAKTARRLNDEDGFVMTTKDGSRRSNADRDSDGGEKSKRKKKHVKRKGGGSDGSGSSGGGDDDEGESGSGSSSFKRGRKFGSDGSRDGSMYNGSTG